MGDTHSVNIILFITPSSSTKPTTLANNKKGKNSIDTQYHSSYTPSMKKQYLTNSINGLTRDELTEVFLQSAIYCGVPAALDAMRVAKEVFAELDGGQ